MCLCSPQFGSFLRLPTEQRLLPCPVSCDCACRGTGVTETAALQSHVWFWEEIHVVADSLLFLLCPGVTFLPSQHGGPVIRNRLVLFEEYYPVWSHWTFPAVILELLESVPRAAVGCPGAWLSPSIPYVSFPSYVPTHSPTSTSATWSAGTRNTNPSSQEMAGAAHGVPAYFSSLTSFLEHSSKIRCKMKQKCPSCPPSHFA